MTKRGIVSYVSTTRTASKSETRVSAALRAAVARVEQKGGK